MRRMPRHVRRASGDNRPAWTRRLAGLGFGFVLLGAVPAEAQSLLDRLMAPFRPAPEPTESLPNELPEDEVECPRVEVFEGGSAVRVFTTGTTGESSALRHQLAIADLARECAKGPGDSLLLKVGVEGRALVGPAGVPGTFTAPLSVIIKRGDTIVARRQRNVSVTVPSGQAQAPFVVVEDAIAVPAGKGTLVIEVGLGAGGGAVAEKPQRRKRH